MIISVQKALVTKYFKIFLVKLTKSSPKRMQIKFAQTYPLKRIVRLNVLFAQTYCSLKRIVPGIPWQTRLNIDFDAPTIGGGSRNSGKGVHLLLQNNVFKNSFHANHDSVEQFYPDLSGLICPLTFCKGKQQTTIADK